MTRNEAYLLPSLLGEMLICDENGGLVWTRRPDDHFQNSEARTREHTAANWNSRYAGTAALNCATPFGHRTGRINDRLYYAHRVVWAMHTGEWPRHEIDHINGDGGDNRRCNLRDVPHLLNLRNQATRKNNTSGFNGVSYFSRDGTWSASISVGGKTLHIGYFATAEAAGAARLAANAKHGFHDNHGRKAA